MKHRHIIQWLAGAAMALALLFPAAGWAQQPDKIALKIINQSYGNDAIGDTVVLRLQKEVQDSNTFYLTNNVPDFTPMIIVHIKTQDLSNFLNFIPAGLLDQGHGTIIILAVTMGTYGTF
jgi:hypothetical protein